MKISKDASRSAKQLFRACQANGRLHPSRIRTVVKRVSEEKPRGYLSILTAFQRLVGLEVQKRRAIVESATRLSPALLQQVRAELQQKYGDDLEFEFVENPALLGGLRVQVGSHVWDGSVRAKIESLGSKLA